MDESMIEGIGSGIEGMGTQQQGSRAGRPGAFETLLKQSVDSVNRLQLESRHEIDKLASGSTENIHETMIAMEKASISFELMMQVRNRLMDAYQEIIKETM